ncbi:MAG: NAD-dependent protein deacylase, partial [Lachnospiraceae bacterium]|nr:NAD-dependent protein deacylase [Lachnospiraceae bacterium]
FFRFYKDKCLGPMLNAKPNAAHLALAKLEEMGKLKAVVTQNIDDLHHRAGSKNILELHGTSFRNHCMECHKEYSVEYIVNSDGIPRCECGGIIKPDVVLYEEGLDQDVIHKSINAISNADVLIIAGTTLIVQPAASFVNYYNGKKLILINLSEVPNESRINYIIRDKVGKVFSEIMEYVESN